MYDEPNETLDFVSVEEHESTQRELRRKIVRERRQRRRLIRKISSRIFIVIIVLVAALLYTFFFRYPRQKIQDNVIMRDLTNGPEFITPIFTEERDLAWDSELPNFMQKDFELAEKEGYSIRYTFGINTIYGKVEDGKRYISLDSPLGSILSISFFDRKENCSIYYSSEHEALIVYGYSSFSQSQFDKVILYSDPTKYPYDKTLTYDKNLPLSMDVYSSIYAVKYDGYSLYFDSEESTFYFYKDGKPVSNRKFYSTVKEVFSYSGFIETENQLIYKMYAYTNPKTGLPDLYFAFVESDLTFLQGKYGYSYKVLEGKELSLPILQNKEGTEFYTVIPEDWDVYMNYGNRLVLKEYKSDCNFNFSVVPLEERFSHAEFYYDGGWKIKFFFLLDGDLFSIKADLDGYDYTFSLTDEEKESLSIRVKSMDDLWEHVEKIREAYSKLYTSDFSSLLQKR